MIYLMNVKIGNMQRDHLIQMEELKRLNSAQGSVLSNADKEIADLEGTPDRGNQPKLLKGMVHSNSQKAD